MKLPQDVIDIVSSPLVMAFAAWLVSVLAAWLAKKQNLTLSDGTQNGLRTVIIFVFGTAFYAVFRYGTPELQELVRALNAIVIASAAGSAAYGVMHAQAVKQGNRALELEARQNELKARAAPPDKRALLGAVRPPLPEGNA